MRKQNYLHISFWVIGLTINSFLFNLFSGKNDVDISIPVDLNEKYLLITDRNIYAGGENIYFKVFNLTPPLIKKKEWSRVFYLELIKSDGKPVTQGKFRLNSNGAAGYIKIPANILTGNYYLMGYT